MNLNTPTRKGKWNELKGRIKETWGELTDDDLDRIEGQRDRLIGLIQQRYGKAREEVEREISEWEEKHGLH